MGNITTRCKINGVILGGEAQGKTTLFQHLVLKHVSEDHLLLSTLGFNFEYMDLLNINIGLWDIGGNDLV